MKRLTSILIIEWLQLFQYIIFHQMLREPSKYLICKGAKYSLVWNESRSKDIDATTIDIEQQVTTV